MEETSLYISDDDQAKLLYIKKYQFPSTFTSFDEQILRRLEAKKYSSPISSNSLSSTPSQSLSQGSNNSSVLDAYPIVVEDNRLIKRQWERVRLVDFEEEMLVDKEHFRATSYFYAVFVNYLRYESSLLLHETVIFCCF
jgi:hypothetical protein